MVESRRARTRRAGGAHLARGPGFAVDPSRLTMAISLFAGYIRPQERLRNRP